VHGQRGELDLALGYYEEDLAIKKQSLGDLRLGVSITLGDIGDAHGARGYFGEGSPVL